MDIPKDLCAFLLLSEPAWSEEEFRSDLQNMWGLTVDDDAAEMTNRALPVLDEEAYSLVLYRPYPVPLAEAVMESAKSNIIWPEAQTIAAEHKAHVIVTAHEGYEEGVDGAEVFTTFVKTVAACCVQDCTAAVCLNGTFFEPDEYIEMSEMISSEFLPVLNWVWFKIFCLCGKVSASTVGLTSFGRREIEIVDADAKPSEVRAFLGDVVLWLLQYDNYLDDTDLVPDDDGYLYGVEKRPGIFSKGYVHRISMVPVRHLTDNDRWLLSS